MKALVTGGGGFLGSHLVRALVARGDEVRVLARGSYPELEALGVEMQRGDIRDADAVARACSARDIVFHAAAMASGWGARAEFEAVNVLGTQHVLDACRQAGVKALVYTSSPSVVHGAHDVEGADESLPYPARYLAHYPRTKAMAERAVLAAAGGPFRTVALRPHFIWGPGDRHLLPRLVERARAGRLRQVGVRDPKTDTTYIDNCVDAHLLAADALLLSAAASGRAYFISDDDPIGLWTMANRMLAAAQAPPVGRPLPAWVAHALGAVLELGHFVLGIESEPLMTRFAASELSHAQWYHISAAKRDLGYVPRVTIDEGLLRLAAWCAASAASPEGSARQR